LLLLFTACFEHSEHDSFLTESDCDTEYTDEDENVEEHWPNICSEDVLQDFDEKDNSESIFAENGFVLLVSKFLLLWAAFYGISNNALDHLIHFFRYGLSFLSSSSPTVTTVLSVFPTSLYMMKKRLNLSDDHFEKYVICRKCCSLYTFKECLQTSVSGKMTPKRCNHIAFRNHPMPSFRTPCDHNLLKEVITKTGKKYYPLKTYCYYPLSKSISSVLGRNDLMEQCEKWRMRTIPNGTLADIYDGRIWKKFMNIEGRPFLSHPYNLGLMLNCDWFQPFDLSTYSVGVLYLVILNLPRSIRFKPENVLIAGIIPGPKEPRMSEMNSYLRPLVKELNSLWSDGFIMQHKGKDVNIHAALLATVCDIPATAKLGGFLGHSSSHACYKCSKVFPYSKELNRVDFSGVDLGHLRTHDEHKKSALQTLSAITPTQRLGIETETGSHYTELMNLSYYDCIRCTIIDPMHNLLLGTPKRLFNKQWVNSGLLNKTVLEKIQDIVSNCTVPSSVGRIPHKLSANFSNLTADEWKNWTLLFSPIALHSYLPSDDYTCWQFYVSACNIYFSSILTEQDIDRADELMRSFFVAAEALYGASFLTINTHLHLHLQEVYKDYGPCYGYWLFSYERYNGILGNFHTNQLSIEIQLMRRFIENAQIKSFISPVDLEHHSIFVGLLGAKSAGSATDTLFGQTTFLNSNITDLASLHTDANVTLLPPFVLYKFDSVFLSYLRTCYQSFIPGVNILEVPQLCRKYKAARWWSQHLKGSEYPAKMSTCIVANWVGTDSCIAEDSCAGSVEYFFSQRLQVGDDLNNYVETKMAFVRWFEEHSARYSLMKPVEIWSTMFKPIGPTSFIPITKITDVCITCSFSLSGEIVTAVNPMRKKIFL